MLWQGIKGKALRTGPLNNNIVINSQMGVTQITYSANKANRMRD